MGASGRPGQGVFGQLAWISLSVGSLSPAGDPLLFLSRISDVSGEDEWIWRKCNGSNVSDLHL